MLLEQVYICGIRLLVTLSEDAVYSAGRTGTKTLTGGNMDTYGGDKSYNAWAIKNDQKYTSRNSSAETTLNVKGIDQIKPEITYEYSNTVINQNKKYVNIVFDVTDKNFSASNLNINNVTVKVGGVTATNIRKVLRSETSITNGKRYTIQLSNFETADFRDYSGVVTIALPAGFATDTYGNSNIAKTITVGIDDPTTGDGHTTGVIVDFIEPTIQKVSATVDSTNKTATVVFNVIDKYLNGSSTLSASSIKILVDGVENTSITKTLSRVTANDVYESVDGSSKIVSQQYSLLLSGINLGANQLKIKIAENAITDLNSNKNRPAEILVFSKLKSTEAENEYSDGFFGNTDIQRQNIEKVIFEANAGVNSGLVRNFDASNNTGTGHSSTTTTWRDLSGNNDGTVNGGTWGTDYIQLDGENDWVNLGEMDFSGNNVTLDVTIEPISIQSDERDIVCDFHDGGVGLALVDGVPTFIVYIKDVGYVRVASSEALTAGQKTRITGTYDGKTACLYIDGQLVNQVAQEGKIVNSDNNTVMAIGANPNGSTADGMFANIKVYDVKIYKEVLPEALINSIIKKWDISMQQDESIIAWTENTSAPYTVHIGSDGNIFANENSSYLFANIGFSDVCTATETIANINLLNTSNVTDMSYMFYHCGFTAMTSLNLGDKFDTSNATDMSYMFSYCGYKSMTSLNLGNNFNTSNVTDMSNMFMACGSCSMTSFNLGDKFDTSNVINMSSMFSGFGYNLMTNLDLGDKFDTSSVEKMFYMFYSCGYKSMTSLNLGTKFDTSSVLDMDSMFEECGYESMTSLDLGPAFTRIAMYNDDMFLDTGKSGAIIYVPESIYKSKTSFKRNSSDTNTEVGTIAVTSGRTVEPKYRPEWITAGATLDETNKNIKITFMGGTVTTKYSSTVIANISANDISIYIDGTELTGISKTLEDVSSQGFKIYELTISNFEETLRRAGKSYKEWSGNISLKIAGRGEDTSTYTKNVLVDSYGNQSMSEIDTTGTWVDIRLEDTEKSTANTDGKMFADFIKPEFTYEYANTTIDHESKKVTVVFDVTDKYFASSTLSTDTNASNITVKFEGSTATNATKTLTKLSDITDTVNGTANTKVGERYKLVVSNLDQGNGGDYSGIMTLSFPAGIISDSSGYTSIAKTITIGVDEPGENNNIIGLRPSELYDSTGNNENGLHIGDFINYDAGTWTTEEINAIQTGYGDEANGSTDLPENEFQFGGFTAGSSRNENATYVYDNDYIKDASTGDAVTGWRVFDIEGDIITLISAGNPEDYYHRR